MFNQILNRMREKVQARRYRLIGHALDNRRMEIVAKLSITGKLVVITAYEL